MTTLEQELEIALRAETPRPSAAFADRLGRAVEAGFPRQRKRRLRLAGRLPVLAAAASVLVALVVVISLLRGGGGQGHGSGASPAAEAPAVHRAPFPAAGAAPAPATPSAPALAGPVRRVERSALLTLGAPRSKLETVANEIVSVVDRRHGFVLHSSVSTGEGGSFDLRVPSGALQGTLRDLSSLADVRSRTQNMDDITASYNAAAGRLQEAQAVRHSLLNRLAQATTDTQAQALRRRIRLVSAQIRSLSTEFDAVRQRARFASIEVTLVREHVRHTAAGSGIGNDFRGALHSLAVSFGVALRILGVMIPLALVGALAWLAGAALRRRRREAALF
jgi:hypothetical protein